MEESVVPNEIIEKLDQSKRIVKYRGISLQWLIRFWGNILDNKIAIDVELVVATELLAEDVWKGRTMQVIGNESNIETDQRTGHVPYRKSKKLQPFFVDQVQSKSRSEWTIGDVCDFVVIPMVLEQQCIFLDLDILDPEIDVGTQFEGAFISQARSCRFQDLLTALNAYYSNKSGNGSIPKCTFVWLDLFCANQPLLTGDSSEDIIKQRCALLSEGFHIAIECFEECLFFFDSWIDPAPLTRAWCIWEIYGAIQSRKPMKLIFVPENETINFVAVLCNDHKKIVEGILNLRPQEAECFDTDGLKMIRARVESTVGWLELKQTVVEQLMTWLIQVTQAVVADFINQTETSDSRARFLNQAGRLLKDIGRYDQAMACFQHALESFRCLPRTEENCDVAATLEEMASVQVAQGTYFQALDLLEECLGIYKAAHDTENHGDVASTLSNMATVYESIGNYDKALELNQRSLGILESLNDPWTLSKPYMVRRTVFFSHPYWFE